MGTKGIQTPQLTVDGALNALYEPVNSIYSLFSTTRMEFYL